MGRPKKKVIYRPNIQARIANAIAENLTIFILIVGEKGFGKSSLAMTMLHDIFQQSLNKEPAWDSTFNHLVFTPQQFYDLYAEAKASVDDALEQEGINTNILKLNPNLDWREMIAMARALGDSALAFKNVLLKYRIHGLLIDDIGAHMNRQDSSIYYNAFYQQLFGDLTLIRPYLAVLVATAPSIEEVPRPILRHVTDLIHCTTRGTAAYRAKRNLVRFKAKNLEGYMKLYDGDPIRWDALDDVVYGQYEYLRHAMSRQVTARGRAAAEQLLHTT